MYDEKGTVCLQESDGRDKMGTHLDTRPASVTEQRLRPGWRLLRVIPFSRVLPVQRRLARRCLLGWWAQGLGGRGRGISSAIPRTGSACLRHC